MDFPGGSDGKASACNEGDPGSIPGSARSLEKETGTHANILASLVAQMVKRLPAMRETQVPSLGWEDPLEKEMAIHCSILAWKIPWMEEPRRSKSMWSQKLRHN